MEQKDRYKEDALGRCGRFITMHEAELGVVITSGPAVQLAASRDGIQAQSVEQDAAVLIMRGLVTREQALTVELRDVQMRSIAQFSSTAFVGSPDISALTRRGGKLKGRKLVAAGRSMAQAGVAHVEALVAGGFPADVIEQLTATTDALESAIAERANTKVARRGATEGLKAQLASGIEAVRMLDGSITRQLAGNRRLLAEWRMAKRITKKPGVTSTSAALKEAARETAQSQAE